MAPIRILHASDLHIAVEERHRSFLDKALADKTFFSKAHNFFTYRGLVEGFWDLVEGASSYELALLRQLAVFIHDAVENKTLDGVILTGDLATTGHEDDIKMVDGFLNEAGDPDLPMRGEKSANPTINFLADRAKLGFQAGNHDRFEYDLRLVRIKGPLYFPKIFDVNGKRFYDLKFNKDPATNTSPVSMFWVRNRLSNGKVLTVFVLTVDLTLKGYGDHEGPFGWIAQGKASKDGGKAIGTLKKLTAKIKKIYPPEGQYRILWACHFPPFFIGEEPSTRLLDPDQLVDAAAKMDVPAILTGHTHHQTNYARPGVKNGIFCCGTTTQFEPDSLPGGSNALDVTKGNHFQILEFDGDAPGNVQLRVEHYKYIRTELNEHFNIIEGPSENATNWKLVSKTPPILI